MTETTLHKTYVSEDAVQKTAKAVGLNVLAQSRWPQAGAAEPEASPGLAHSSFSPVVAAIAGRCLARWYGSAPLPPQVGDRIAIVLVSARGDAAIAQSADGDGEIPPLLSFRSVANAVLGHVASVWGIRGPLLCASPVGDPDEDALSLAAGVLVLGDADTALVVRAEPACTDDEQDWSYALLVRDAARIPNAFGRDD